MRERDLDRGRCAASIPSKLFTPPCDGTQNANESTWLCALVVHGRRRGVEGACGAETRKRGRSARCTRSSASLANAFTGSFSSAACCSSQPPSPSPHCLFAPHETCRSVSLWIRRVRDDASCDANGAALRTFRHAEPLIPVATKSRSLSDRQPKEPPIEHHSMRAQNWCEVSGCSGVSFSFSFR